MNITAATHKDGSLTYNDANTPYTEGDTFSVGETIDLSIDGQLKSVHVESAEVDSVSAEYVVHEDEWYVNYTLTFYGPDSRELTSERLTPDDIQNDDMLILVDTDTNGEA